MKCLRLSVLCMLLVSLTTGCDLAGDDDDDDLADIEGTWEATTFQLTAQGETYDILAQGGALRMTLQENGTVDDGFLSAPCSLPGVCEEGEEGDLEIAFEGTYDVDGQTVSFDHDEDTFIRDPQTVWVYDGDAIATETPALEVVLER